MVITINGQDIEARVIQKIATEAEWAASTILPRKGEFMIVADSTGTPTNIKVGNGVDMYPALPYMFDSIQQNVNYYPVNTFALPTPVGDNVFSLVVEGDYTFGGNPAFTVPEGSLGIISWNGSVWSLDGEQELPTRPFNPEDINPYLEAGTISPFEITSTVDTIADSVILKDSNGQITVNTSALIYVVPVQKGDSVSFSGSVGSTNTSGFLVLTQFDLGGNFVEELEYTFTPYTEVSNVAATAVQDGFIYVNSRIGTSITNHVYKSSLIITTASEVIQDAYANAIQIDKIMSDNLGGEVEVTNSVDTIEGMVMLLANGGVPTANASSKIYKVPVLEGDTVRFSGHVGSGNTSGFAVMYQYNESENPAGLLAVTYTPSTDITDVSAVAAQNGWIYVNSRANNASIIYNNHVYKGKNDYFVRDSTLADTDVIQNLQSQIDDIPTVGLPKNKLANFWYQKDFSSDWNMSAGFTLDTNNNLVSGSSGGVALLNRRYISDIRKSVYRISGATAGVIRLGSLQNTSLSSLLYSSCCEINITSNTINIFRGGGSNGIATLTGIATKEIGIDISNGELIVEFHRNREISTVKLTNAYTREYEVLTFDGRGTRFALGAGNHRPFYFIYSTSAITLSEFSVVGAYDISVAHVGDSISESNGRADTSTVKNKNWVDQLIDYVEGDIANTSQSGMTVDDGLTALENEITFMKPKMLSVSLGTNGGFTSIQLQQFIDFCDEKGIPLIINHIPMTPTRAPESSNSAETVNSMIDSFNRPGSLMDYATATGGNIANGADLSNYNSDQLHPNAQGNNRMFERFLIDVSQINWLSRE